MLRWSMSGYTLVTMCSIVPFSVLILFLVVIRFNPLFSKRQNTILVTAVVINILMISVIGADFLLSSVWFETAWIFRRITSFLNFACSPAIPLLLYMIYNKGKKSAWFYLPALLNLLLCGVSIFYKLIFYIAQENTYGRGPLFFVPFAVCLFYIAAVFFQPAKYQARSKRVERLLLLAIVGLLLLSMYLEIAFNMRMLVWNGSAAGLVLYYLLLNIHNFALDPLTGAYNRVMYNNALEGIKDATPCTMALIDINDFKQVNDQFGHAAGDRCLIEFTEVLNRSFHGCATVYRIGGDEFALLSKGRARVKFSKCLEMARAEAGKKDIRFACGMLEYGGTGDMEACLREIDKRMYKNKTELKQG